MATLFGFTLGLLAGRASGLSDADSLRQGALMSISPVGGLVAATVIRQSAVTPPSRVTKQLDAGADRPENADLGTVLMRITRNLDQIDRRNRPARPRARQGARPRL